MSNFTVNKTYDVESIPQKKDSISVLSNYSINLSFGKNTEYGSSIRKALPSDLDVFSELPKQVYENDDVSAFLNALSHSISKVDERDITFSKLIPSELSDSNITLEWIFNYFRRYFSFDKETGNQFGIVGFDESKTKFFNEFETVDVKDFYLISDKIVNSVISMIKGKNSE